MKSMYCLFLVLTAAAVVHGKSASDFQEKVRPLAIKCQEETKASDEDVEAVVNLETNITPSGKCLLYCVEKKIGLIKNDKNIRYNENPQIYQQLFANDPEKSSHAETAVDPCIIKAEEKAGDDVCLRAYNAYVCFLGGQ